MKEKKSEALIATHHEAGRDYFILEVVEAGLVLAGCEVKSLRDRKASLAGSFARLEGDINQVCDDFPQFDRAMVGRPEDWRDFRPRLLSILADITLQADGSYQYLKELKIDSTHQEFDTLVLTPRSGQPVGVPLMQ